MEEEHPERFVACPTIPIFDPKLTIGESERVTSHKTKAVFIQPYNWRLDYDYLSPVFEKLDNLKYRSSFILCTSSTLEKSTATTVQRRLLDSHLIRQSQCPDSFGRSGFIQNLKFVIPHLGGALPFLLRRLETTFDPEKRPAKLVPAHYLDRFCFDIVCYRKEALELALSVFGSRRLCLVLILVARGKKAVQPQLLKDFVASLEVSDR